MSNKEKRQQTEDREWLSEEVKMRIPRKSGDRCVWCGKKVFLGYEGTIDHFIPLKKGGTNDEVNLVLMCHECNQKKGSRIFPLNVAGTYLNDKHKEELGKYFENYVEKYDYLSRGNLMSSDVYEMFFFPPAYEDAKEKAKRKGKPFNVRPIRSKYLLKRAYPDDQERIVEYFIKYLKKYKILRSPEAARENIKFWMRFGTIYFIEKNNEIATICCAVVNSHGYISFDIFTYYSTLLAWTMSTGIIDCLGGAIMEENNLPYLPISFNMVVEDELTKYRIPGEEKALSDSQIMCKLAFMYNSCYQDPEKSDAAKEAFNEGIRRYSQFIHRFDDNIDDEIMLYLYQHDLMEFSWMGEEILDRDFFEEGYYQEID